MTSAAPRTGLRARWMAAAATGYILMFFSELLFVNVIESPVTPEDLALTYVFYVLEAVIFLAIVDRFRVRSLWALFLVGAVYGWLLEGIINPTMYQAFPIYVSFTGLAWHAPLDVILGWYAINRLLLMNRPRLVALAAALIGLFWGVWAIWPWYEPGVVLPPDVFAAFTWGSSLLLVAAYWLYQRAGAADFHPSHWLLGLLAALHLFLFVVNVIPTIPLALLVLPPLLAITFWALSRHRQGADGSQSLLADLSGGGVGAASYAALLTMPLTASVLYGLFGWLGVVFPTNIPIFLILTPLGFLLFALSIWQAGFRRRRQWV